MINLFADLSKNDMIEEIRHPEKKTSENMWDYDLGHRLNL